MPKFLSDNEIIELARDQYEREGELEIDDNAVVSHGSDTGAYVQSWVWVDFVRCRECERPMQMKEDEDTPDCDEYEHCSDHGEIEGIPDEDQKDPSQL